MPEKLLASDIIIKQLTGDKMWLAMVV